MLMVFIAIGIVALFAMLIWEVVIPTQKQRVWVGVVAVSLIPVGMAAYVALLKPNQPIHNRVTPLALVVAILGNLFPSWLVTGLAALGLFFLGWVTRPGMVLESDKGNNGDKKKVQGSRQQNLAKAAKCGFLLYVVLFSENFLIWVVSATFERGWDPRTAPDPLQDNGRRVLQHVFSSLDFTKKDVVAMRRVWNIQYALVASLGIGLLTADFHPTRQLWSLAARGITSLASARLIRTISFLLTVLPSQNKFCYRQHFPNPPPSDWYSWIMEGMSPQTAGGCNDLIVSGHATVTTIMACVAVSLSEDPIFGIAVAWLLGMDYLIEVYEGFHYSVDMWMGAVLVTLLWMVLKPIEDNNTERNAATFQDMVNRFQTESITVNDIIKYGGPVLVAYLQVVGFFPRFATMFLMCGITLWCVAQMVSQGFQHYTQHLLFSVLFIAIGCFL